MTKFLSPIFLVITLSIFTSCSPKSNDAPSVVQAYYHSLVTGDYNRVANYSCAEWEADAKIEFDSFTAVTAELQNFDCTDAGQEGEFTLVNCTGKIIANYGDEILEIDLSKQTYLAAYEGGEWRMCGYR